MALQQQFSALMGQGIDTDPNDQPAYPMRRPTAVSPERDWERPPQQHPHVEILHSNERPNLTATFGTSSPPRGLSGVLRRVAFHYSESSYSHWMLLILADRINMIEGIGQDLLSGHMPNIFKEMGMRSEMKYNPRGFAIKAGVTALTIILVARWLRRR
jgi:hypothetical protein